MVIDRALVRYAAQLQRAEILSLSALVDERGSEYVSVRDALVLREKDPGGIYEVSQRLRDDCGYTITLSQEKPEIVAGSQEPSSEPASVYAYSEDPDRGFQLVSWLRTAYSLQGVIDKKGEYIDIMA